MTTPTRTRSTRQTAAPAPQPDSPAAQDLDTHTRDTRRAMIAEAAFLISESRGFAPGQELDDWLVAESAVAQQLGTDLH